MSNCWLWSGSRNLAGYGQSKKRGSRTTLGAHRSVYETLVGKIPKDLTIDHLCRNPGCVNPEHLEAVTLAENIRRAHAPMEKAVGPRQPPRAHP